MSRLIAVAVALTLVVVAASCQSDNGTDAGASASPLARHQVNAGLLSSTSLPFDPNSSLPKLQFEGDSITHQSAADIYEHFRRRYNLAIQAKIGISTLEEVPTNTAAQAELRPRIEVINLGTNDAVRAERASASPGTNPLMPRRARSIDEVLDNFTTIANQFPTSTCLVFVTVNTHNPSWAPANAKRVNERLAQIAMSRPHTVLADWNAAWRPKYFDRSDNPHPNERGRRALLVLEDRAIARCSRRANR